MIETNPSPPQTESSDAEGIPSGISVSLDHHMKSLIVGGAFNQVGASPTILSWRISQRGNNKSSDTSGLSV